MKIHINYDLLETIMESEHGLCLEKAGKRGLMYIGMANAILIPALLPLGETVLSLSLVADSMVFASLVSIEKFASKLVNSKKEASNNLNTLVSKLQNMNIYTNKELLKEAQKYKTEYKLEKTENKIPYLLQKQYINIPTENKDVSIVQEHIMGSLDYYLSKGSPKEAKVFKLAVNTN